LTAEQLRFEPDALRRAIGRYTREAGVRELERVVGRVARKVARRFAEGRAEPVAVRVEDLADLLGQERVRPERHRTQLPAGVSTGLAWTEAGGDVLYVEANLLHGGRGLRLTGQLGKVMKESARAAQTFVWSHADALGIDPDLFRRSGVHIHVPAGAVPKDGPSAGVALVTALASLYTGVPVRSDVAMTGEITLAGLVLPVGGIKEKVLAARRAGLRHVILPRDNEQDLRELPEQVRKELTFTLAERIEDALSAALPDFGRRLRVVPSGDQESEQGGRREPLTAAGRME
jgi:ATP-dependent Lon protease